MCLDSPDVGTSFLSENNKEIYICDRRVITPSGLEQASIYYGISSTGEDIRHPILPDPSLQSHHYTTPEQRSLRFVCCTIVDISLVQLLSLLSHV